MNPKAPPTIVDAIAQGNPAAALANLYSTVEVRTSITPPIYIGVQDAFSNNGQQTPSPLVQFIKPTVILSGPAGRVSISPYGEAGDGTALAVLCVAGLVGIGVLIGRWSVK